jgi:nitrogen fixation/metabolism regulation signal transduction histidine kinase
MGIIIIVQMVLLIHFLNKTNRKIAYFFNAVENEDSTIYFPENIQNKSLTELNKSLNRVNLLIQKIKIENKTQEQYYHSILKQAAIGVLTINDKGHVIFANTMAKTSLNYEYLTHVNQLKKVDLKLYKLISELQPFDQKLIQLSNEREIIELTIKGTPLVTSTEKLILVTIQNIHNELNDKELDSWIRLISVLTHEIMNSIAPMTSLSETLSGFYRKGNQDIQPKDITEKSISDTLKGLDVIKKQGDSLINFVSSYRSLTGIPNPEKQLLSVQELFEKVQILVSQEEGFDQVRFTMKTRNNLQVFADENQLMQVLVNLTKNALQSLKEKTDGVIELTGEKDDYGKIKIYVIDNGPGIPIEILDQIFVPFFTTKETGTGIGLSLSKHILRLHGGSLIVTTLENERTAFVLSF